MDLRIAIAFISLAVACAAPAQAATREDNRVADATDVLDQLLRIPEQSIPPTLLSRAYAVAVIPSVVKVGFGLGARRGKGVVVVRRDDNSWSNPSFITLTGGSFGFQIGAQSSDIILVFKNRKGVDGLTKGKLTLGADAAISAGPVGRYTSASTDIKFRAEVYSYSRSRGLFAGIALDGAGLTIDKKANAAYYGTASITPKQIFNSSGNAVPQSANNFVQLLTAQTSRLPTQPGMGVASNRQRSPAKAPATPPARTYGIGDPSAPDADEGVFSQQF